MTLAELFADPASSSPAIVATSPATTLSYKALSEQIERLSGRLAAAGLKPGDCVAIALPNGLAFLVLLLALTRARLIAALLNPADESGELRATIQDAQARAVVAEPASAAATAATGLGVPVWTPAADASGAVTVAQLPQAPPGELELPGPADIAIYAYTSGTTSKPKCVPLTHANVSWSARNVAAGYRLTTADRTLVVLPLFHGHGLIGAALSTLASGGTVVVPPRFSASAFWPQFAGHRATWYTAVPTIHQILLERADADGAPSSGPRFVRSCSAPLSNATLANVERRFGTPLLEAYGMTEAAHQVATNPLPPLPRKPGTVGPSPEIAVIDGEVVVRGPNVMQGYRNDPEASAAAFVDGWFRTGDLGKLDGDGYLTLTGRIKDIIDRGGEKISPEAVEAVLLEHPAVAQAAAFGEPDPKYGEQVQAAVVLRSGAGESELRAFCSERLASFEVPAAIHAVSALPVNALGKVQRAKLKAMFAPATDAKA